MLGFFFLWSSFSCCQQQEKNSSSRRSESTTVDDDPTSREGPTTRSRSIYYDGMCRFLLFCVCVCVVATLETLFDCCIILVISSSNRRIFVSMDQSLDSIIKSKRQEKRATARSRPNTAEKKTFKSSGGGRGANKAKNGGASAAATAAAAQRKTVVVRRQREPAASSASQGSIFDRLGSAGSGRAEAGGTKVEIRGLTKAVTKADITQLCESIGDVKSVHKKFDMAEVVFERRSNAMSAIKKFHGLTLDGVPMAVTLAGDRGRSNPFDPNDPGADEGGGRGKGKGNVREGFFGTRGSSAPSSTIDFGYKKPAKAREQTITVTFK